MPFAAAVVHFIFLFRNLVKPSEMPRPLALTGITAHTQKHFTSSDKTQKKNIYRVAQNKIPHRRICNISATNGLILKILEAA